MYDRHAWEALERRGLAYMFLILLTIKRGHERSVSSSLHGNVMARPAPHVERPREHCFGVP